MRADLLDQIVERLVAGVRIELRGLDDEQRRGVVVKEEMVVRLVQLPQVVVVGLERDGFGVASAGCGRGAAARRSAPADRPRDRAAGRRARADRTAAGR